MFLFWEKFNIIPGGMREKGQQLQHKEETVYHQNNKCIKHIPVVHIMNMDWTKFYY